MRLALKVDVDTLVGYREGVPALLSLLAGKDIRASFFVAMGPDHSGRAIRRLFTHRGFLHKMFRTRAPRLYGFKTLLYGTLLPGPQIVAAAPELLTKIVAGGHELGIHGYDHVRWQDRLPKLSLAEIGDEIRQAQEVITRRLGYPAISFAAPGWQTTATAWEALVRAGFYYVSNTRGQGPYWPVQNGKQYPLLEIPTTLPTLDEQLGLNGRRAADFNREIGARLQSGQTAVLTLHAEVEGRLFLREFENLLDYLLARQVQFIRLLDWAQELHQQPQTIPAAAVVAGELPGRAGQVSLQGPTLRVP